MVDILSAELGRRHHCLYWWKAHWYDLGHPSDIPITIEMVLDCSDRPRLLRDHIKSLISLRLRQIRAHYQVIIGHLVNIDFEEHCTC